MHARASKFQSFLGPGSRPFPKPTPALSTSGFQLQGLKQLRTGKSLLNQGPSEHCCATVCVSRVAIDHVRLSVRPFIRWSVFTVEQS